MCATAQRRRIVKGVNIGIGNDFSQIGRGGRVRSISTSLLQLIMSGCWLDGVVESIVEKGGGKKKFSSDPKKQWKIISQIGSGR